MLPYCYNFNVHESQRKLLVKLQQAAKKVQVGGVYFHYKNPDKAYKVLNLAVTEADDEVCVIYQA
jgi:hypothetical protein